MSQLFEYQNTWNTPRLGFLTDFLYPNIGKHISASSQVSGLVLEEYSETNSFLRSLGAFKVTGQYEDIKLFAQPLEKTYWDYLSFHADWDEYDALVERLSQ